MGSIVPIVGIVLRIHLSFSSSFSSREERVAVLLRLFSVRSSWISTRLGTRGDDHNARKRTEHAFTVRGESASFLVEERRKE